MKLKALGILGFVGLFSAGSLVSGAAFAGDYKKHHRYDNAHVANDHRQDYKHRNHLNKKNINKHYVCRDRGHKHAVKKTPYANKRFKRVASKKIVKKPGYYRHEYRPAPRIVEKRVVVHQSARHHNHDGLGLLVGGILLGGILANQ